MRTLRLGKAIAVAAITLLARASFAADDVQSFDVTFSAPDDCPSYYSFIEQVLARTSRARSSRQAPDYRFTLTITGSDGGLRGELAIVGAQGIDNTRDVPGQDCVSVVEAAALIAALVLDPHASTAPLSPAVGALPTVPGEQPRAASPVKPNEAAAIPPEADAAPERAPPPASASAMGFRVGLGAGAMLNGAVAPGVTPGVALGVRLLDTRDSVVAPMLGLDAQLASTGAIRSELGSASFLWLAGRLWGCPLSWQNESFALRPCAFFDAGMVRAKGQETFRGRTHTVPWFAVGALGRFEWKATRIAGFELQAGAVFPLFRDRYVFLPEDFVHKVPPVGVTASAGATLWLN